MSDESSGFEWTIVEIAEISIAVLLFIVIGTALFVAPNTDFMQIKATNIELAHITNLITNTNINVKTKYPSILLSLTANELKVQSSEEEKLISSQEVYGTEHKITKLDNDLYCLSSYKTCNNNSATIKGGEGQLEGEKVSGDNSDSSNTIANYNDYDPESID